MKDSKELLLAADYCSHDDFEKFLKNRLLTPTNYYLLLNINLQEQMFHYYASVL